MRTTADPYPKNIVFTFEKACYAMLVMFLVADYIRRHT